MATNERVSTTFKDVDYQQGAQTGRTKFTPGKTSSLALDQNWPVDFKVPTGNALVDSGDGIDHVRVIKLDRNSVCDQTIAAPVVEGTSNRSQTGTAHSGTYVFTETTTQNNNGSTERKTGSEWAGTS